jgi:hypothetical protein
MIQCKILSHCKTKTIQYPCEDCGRMNVRSFEAVTRESYDRTCWFCNKKQQPPMLDIVCHQMDRIQHHFSLQPVVSGIY